MSAPAKGVGLDLLAWVEGTDEDGYGSRGDGRRFGRRAAPDVRDEQEALPIVDALGAHGVVPPAPARSLDKGLGGDSTGRSCPADDPEGEAWVLPAALLALMWPVLRVCRCGPLALVRVSLTAPRGRDVRSPALDLAMWVAARPGEGAVLVLDRRPRDGAEHWYGIALVHDDGAALVAHWCALTGANAKGQAVDGVTGWSEHMEGDSGMLRANMERVLRYAFRLGPVAHGPRDIDLDVIACGSLAAPWHAARAYAKGDGVSKPPDPCKSSPPTRDASRKCSRCWGPMPAGKRSDALHCSDRCRKSAHRARKA